MATQTDRSIDLFFQIEHSLCAKLAERVAMDIYQIEILEPGAKRLLDDMAELELISIRDLNASPGINAADRRAEIMALAGAWSVMAETDFSEYLNEAKRSGNEIFGRDVSL